MTEATPALTLDSTIAHNEDVLFSEVADGMSLMDIESGKYFHYDETGTAVWKAIDGDTAVAKICDALTAQYDVDPETCQKDTLAFVNELAGHGLIKAQ